MMEAIQCKNCNMFAGRMLVFLFFVHVGYTLPAARRTSETLPTPTQCGQICYNQYQVCIKNSENSYKRMDKCTSIFVKCYPKCYFKDLKHASYSSETACIAAGRRMHQKCKHHAPTNAITSACHTERDRTVEHCKVIFKNKNDGETLMPVASALKDSDNSVDNHKKDQSARSADASRRAHYPSLSGPLFRLPDPDRTYYPYYKPCWRDCDSYYRRCTYQVVRFEDMLICRRARSRCRDHPTCLRS